MQLKIRDTRIIHNSHATLSLILSSVWLSLYLRFERLRKRMKEVSTRAEFEEVNSDQWEWKSTYYTDLSVNTWFSFTPPHFKCE